MRSGASFASRSRIAKLMNQMTPTTTVPAVPKPTTGNYGYIIIALVVIVVLAVIAYALTRRQRAGSAACINFTRIKDFWLSN